MSAVDKPIRLISIITPMLDEADHVETLVADIAAQDFDGELEILVADGGSSDGSADRLLEAATRFGLDVSVLPNPARWVSAGLNACIRRATGDLLVRLDCHTRYPSNYLTRCAVASEATRAWSVGGIVVPVGRTTTERAVACAAESPFGGVHWSRHNSSAERVEVDVAYCGAFRPEAFEAAGLYDESLVRNQDDELTLRFRRAGGRIVLDPSIRAYYTPRGSYRAVARQYYEYGLWKTAVMRKHRQVISARSLVPGALVASVGALALAGARSRRARWLLGAELIVYAASATTFATVAVRRRREQWSLVPRAAAVFPLFHLGYGVGLLRGSARFLRARLARGSPVER